MMRLAGASDLIRLGVQCCEWLDTWSPASSGSRRHESVDDAGRFDRMPGLACEHQCGLNLQVRKGRPPLVNARIELAFFPDQDSAVPPQIAHVDPRRELWIAMGQNVRAIRRIDREIVDGE